MCDKCDAADDIMEILEGFEHRECLEILTRVLHEVLADSGESGQLVISFGPIEAQHKEKMN